MTTATDVQKVADLIKKNNIQIIDLKFTDLPGLWQHFSIPPKDMVEFDDLQGSIWVDGIGFDGSSIRGFQEIQESDMILIESPRRRKRTSSPPVSQTLPTGALNSNSSSSMTSVTTRTSMRATTTSTQSKVNGTPAATLSPTSATSPVTRKATFRSHRTTHSRTFAAKWSSRWRKWESQSRCTTMR